MIIIIIMIITLGRRTPRRSGHASYIRRHAEVGTVAYADVNVDTDVERRR